MRAAEDPVRKAFLPGAPPGRIPDYTARNMLRRWRHVSDPTHAKGMENTMISAGWLWC